jgi:hypothetical protein
VVRTISYPKLHLPRFAPIVIKIDAAPKSPLIIAVISKFIFETVPVVRT